MSKQIYIDSNGNEIQVSGTVNTADMMPMSGNDSTKVSEAIGDLSQLTTTDKSSLVGAVKELDRDKADKTQLATTAFTGITPATNVSIKVNKSHYITDKVVHLFVIFQITANISNAKLCDITANDCAGVSFPIFCADSQWGAYSTICYGYMSTTSITATVTTAKPYLCIDTIIALS